jgi:hypothetical protein
VGKEPPSQPAPKGLFVASFLQASPSFRIADVHHRPPDFDDNLVSLSGRAILPRILGQRCIHCSRSLTRTLRCRVDANLRICRCHGLDTWRVRFSSVRECNLKLDKTSITLCTNKASRRIHVITRRLFIRSSYPSTVLHPPANANFGTSIRGIHAHLPGPP